MGRRSIVATLVALLVVGVVVIPRLVGAQQEQICFSTVPNVANCVQGRFAQFWQANGGLELFGFPITGEVAEEIDGVPRIVQYFERARFELHPENAAPFDVLLGRLGAMRLEQQGRSWFGFPRLGAAPGEDCLFSPVTGHAVCGEFLGYYRSRGVEIDGEPGFSEAESAVLFGLPISEPQVETNAGGVQVITQWFERARFEYQPANPEGLRVLLGLVGSETVLSFQQAQVLPTPTALPRQPTPTPNNDDDDDDDDDGGPFISREGTITSLGSSSFTLDADGRTFTVEFGSYTNIIRNDGSKAGRGDLAVGQRVFARGEQRSRNTIRARTIIIGGRNSSPNPTATPAPNPDPPPPYPYPAP